MRRQLFAVLSLALASTTCNAAKTTVIVDTGDAAHPGAEDINNIFSFEKGAGSYFTHLDHTTHLVKDLRSGGVGENGRATIKDEISVTKDSYLTEVWFDFQYVIGFCIDDQCPKHDGLPVMELFARIMDGGTNSSTVLWTSSKNQIVGYGNNASEPYSFDACNSGKAGHVCHYAPVQQIKVKGINVLQKKNSKLQLAFQWENNKYNMQIPITKGTGLNMKVIYAPHKEAGNWGAPFLLATFIGFSVYLVSGVMLQQKRHGLAGIESVPNIEFWRGLPSLVKDGMRFSLGCLGRKAGLQVAAAYGQYEDL